LPLGTEVGLGLNDIVLHGNTAPQKGTAPIFGPYLLWPWEHGSPKRAQPRFSAHMYCGQTALSVRIPLGTEVGLSLGDIVLNGDPAPAPLKGHSPQLSSNVCCGQTAGWTKMPLGMELCLGPGDFVFDGEPAQPRKKGTAPPIFGQCLLWPNGWMDEDATWY